MATATAVDLDTDAAGTDMAVADMPTVEAATVAADMPADVLDTAA